MKLAQVQSAMFSLITQDKRTWLRPDVLVAGGALDAAERVHIYAEMYRLRTRDALREDFPHTAELLGDQWDATVDAYVDRFHSEHPSLHRLGRAFAGFLGERKGLGELAALEWARSEAFVETDSPVATQAAIAALGPEKLPAAKITLSKSLRLLELTYDVDPVWRALDKQKKRPALKKKAQRLVVWRKGDAVFHVAVEADELEALRRAQRGATVAEVLEAFAGREDPASAAFTALASWLNEEMLAEIA
ncbi:MAG: DNA-binding domain-containing protein [Myxococcaceae bacterium]